MYNTKGPQYPASTPLGLQEFSLFSYKLKSFYSFCHNIITEWFYKKDEKNIPTLIVHSYICQIIKQNNDEKLIIPLDIVYLILKIYRSISKYSIGDWVDIYDEYQWKKAQIIYHKPKYQQLPSDFEYGTYSYDEMSEIDKMEMELLECVLISTDGDKYSWSNNYKWIFFINNNSICECINECIYTHSDSCHQLTLPNNHTQTIIQSSNTDHTNINNDNYHNYHPNNYPSNPSRQLLSHRQLSHRQLPHRQLQEAILEMKVEINDITKEQLNYQCERQYRFDENNNNDNDDLKYDVTDKMVPYGYQDDQSDDNNDNNKQEMKNDIIEHYIKHKKELLNKQIEKSFNLTIPITMKNEWEIKSQIKSEHRERFNILMKDIGFMDTMIVDELWNNVENRFNSMSIDTIKPDQDDEMI